MNETEKDNTTYINTVYKKFKKALNKAMSKNSMKAFFQLMDKLDLGAECLFEQYNDYQIALFEAFYIILYNLALKTSYKVASDTDLSDTNLLRKDMIDNAIDHVLEPRILLKVWDRESQYRYGYLVNTLRNHFVDQIRAAANDLYVSLEQQEPYELDMLMYSNQQYQFSSEMIMEQGDQKRNEDIYGKALYEMYRHYMYDLLNWATKQKSLELIVCNYLCNFKLLKPIEAAEVLLTLPADDSQNMKSYVVDSLRHDCGLLRLSHKKTTCLPDQKTIGIGKYIKLYAEANNALADLCNEAQLNALNDMSASEFVNYCSESKDNTITILKAFKNRDVVKSKFAKEISKLLYYYKPVIETGPLRTHYNVYDYMPEEFRSKNKKCI